MYERLSRSGQNNPDNFEQLFQKQRYSITLNAVGKKCMVSFKVLRCESTEERNDLLDYILRTIPACAMVDSYEACSTKPLVTVQLHRWLQ